MSDLNALSSALRNTASAEQKLAGLNEKAEQYKQMRDTPVAEANQFGYLSPMLGLASALRGVVGERKMRAQQPERDAIRQTIAEGASALPLYKAGQEEKARKLAEKHADRAYDRGVLEFNTTEDNQLSAAKALAESRANARNAPEAWVNSDGTGQVTGFMTDSGFIGADGLPIDVSNKIPYREYSVATRSVARNKAKAKKDGEPLDRVGSPDLISQILDSDLLQTATGTLNPERWAGKFGYSLDPSSPATQGPEIQALQAKMSDVGIDSVKTNLQGLGINPTDKDLDVAFASIPTAGTQPLAWAIWGRDQYLPMLKKAGGEAVIGGSAEAEDILGYISQVEASVANALERYGEGPPEEEGTVWIDANGNKALVGPDKQVIRELD